MDGTRDREALHSALCDAWAHQQVTFEKNGHPLTTPEEINHHLRETIDSQIATFAREGLLGD
jgi:methyltransferase-like protein